jgi:Ca2+-binding EF-hand superfamily protein
VRIRRYHLFHLFSKGTGMRYLVSCFALVAASVLALTAIAQPPEKDGKKGDDRRAEMRERMLKEFDANKDGKLDDEERGKAREKMGEMRGARGGE